MEIRNLQWGNTSSRSSRSSLAEDELMEIETGKTLSHSPGQPIYFDGGRSSLAEDELMEIETGKTLAV